MSGPTLADVSGSSPGGTVNPITLEVVRSAVYSIAEEMRVIVMRSARSPLLKEAGDLTQPLKKGALKKTGVRGDLFQLCAGKAKGRSRSALDTVIAAVAEANGCVVVTDNEKDFPGIETLNPLRAAD